MSAKGTPWFKCHSQILNHPKTFALADALDEDHIYSLGRIVAFLSWVNDYEPDGNVTGASVRQIEHTVRWLGTRGAFYQAMVDTGWIDVDEHGTATVHNWLDYNDGYVRAAAQKERRAKAKADRELAKRQPPKPKPTPPPPPKDEPARTDDVTLQPLPAYPTRTAHVPHAYQDCNVTKPTGEERRREEKRGEEITSSSGTRDEALRVTRAPIDVLPMPGPTTALAKRDDDAGTPQDLVTCREVLDFAEARGWDLKLSFKCQSKLDQLLPITGFEAAKAEALVMAERNPSFGNALLTLWTFKVERLRQAAFLPERINNHQARQRIAEIEAYEYALAPRQEEGEP